MKINKHKLISYIQKDIDYAVSRIHLVSIISILIEELLAEIRNKKKLNIKNFGTFRISELMPRKIRSIKTGQIKFVRKVKILRFRLSKGISKYILKSGNNDT